MKYKKISIIFILFLLLIVCFQSVTANELADIKIKGGRGILIDIESIDEMETEIISEPWHLKEWYNLSFIFSLNPMYQEPSFHLFDEDEEVWGAAGIIFSTPRLAIGTFTVEISVSNSTARDTAKASGFFFGRWTILNQIY